jgi:hypothetical protein
MSPALLYAFCRSHRAKELKVTICADPPANAHLRGDRISAKGAFFLYMAAERNVAIATILCLVPPAQYSDLAQPAIRLDKEGERNSFLADLHRRSG